jgi:hypothetical protein
VRTAREPDLDGLYDLIADVRTNGDHRPLTIGSKSEWIRRFARTAGGSTAPIGCSSRARGKLAGYVSCCRPSHSHRRLGIGYPILQQPQQGVLARRHWPCEIA